MTDVKDVKTKIKNAGDKTKNETEEWKERAEEWAKGIKGGSRTPHTNEPKDYDDDII